MPSDSTPLPGSLTVPPLYGWVGIVALVVLAALVGIGFLVVGAMARSESRAMEWQSWLEARSRSGVDIRMDAPPEQGAEAVSSRPGS
jgi:hypothetical protein